MMKEITEMEKNNKEENTFVVIIIVIKHFQRADLINFDDKILHDAHKQKV